MRPSEDDDRKPAWCGLCGATIPNILAGPLDDMCGSPHNCPECQREIDLAVEEHRKRMALGQFKPPRVTPKRRKVSPKGQPEMHVRKLKRSFDHLP